MIIKYEDFVDGQRVILSGIEYRVSLEGYENYLHCCNFNNDKIFYFLSKNKESFFLKVLGYCNAGDFPFCENPQDLYKIYVTLKNLEVFPNRKMIQIDV